jgi:alpha-L-fucosidase
MERRQLLKNLMALAPAFYLQKAMAHPFVQAPLFQPSWTSLSAYQVPGWFRDAKFGIWAHWGPQCQPEYGDWYARGMYQEGSDQYKYHLNKYGHPSVFGFKDVINSWKAEKWNPEELLALYKKAGARYFVALANHHDNFDLYNSRHHTWNATRIGPKKDLIAGWAKAARKQGLPFGVSVHASHAWSWYEVAQRSDKQGDKAGTPYDGKLTKADGKGSWWEGLDPQELYAQNHSLSQDSENNNAIHRQWGWENGVTVPDKNYCENFYNRVADLIDQYAPDLLYFDDTALPLWPISDAGLRIAAHLYNSSIKKKGSNQAVLNGKILDELQRKCMVWDIERGQSNRIEPFPWQTDTCIGNWHYDRRVYDNNRYKSAKTVVHSLIDIVSKNGNLLLNVPLRGDGSMDEKERVVVEGIAAWMQVNSECIYDTRPWQVAGEGPAMEAVAPLQAQGFNEGKGKPLSEKDFRFTVKGQTLYAAMMGWPADGVARIESLGDAKGKKVQQVSLLGYKGNLQWQQQQDVLTVQLPEKAPCEHAFVFRIV